MMLKLINRNCLDALVNMPDKHIIVTDPPFNIGYRYRHYKDKMKTPDYLDMLNKMLTGKRSVVIHYAEVLHQISIAMGVPPCRVVSWVYNSNTARQHRQIAFYGVMPDFRKVGQPYKNPKDKRIAKRIAEGKSARLYDWWNINQVKNTSAEKTEHPCQMPLEVMKNIIGVLPDGITVVDPFMGSGTTGVACVEAGVDFIGIEEDKVYFNIAQNRLSV